MEILHIIHEEFFPYILKCYELNLDGLLRRFGIICER
jgi:hypothetical protein